MARPLRYQAAGAVYHVMARGDGGKVVFEEEKDHFSWLDGLERTCARFGWRVHAWVLMGNHCHLLLETPEPNLVPGMKRMLGVHSQAWNRRRQWHGHVFQGRYKSVVVNGEERDGSYFKIIADYIHLNPARSGRVGGTTGKTMRSWRWSSFPAYGGGKAPEWLETARVLRAFRLCGDAVGGKAYGCYLEARAKDPKTAVTDASLAELRRGWFLGEKRFGEQVLAALSGPEEPKRRKGSLGCEAPKAHDEAQAERIAKAGLAALEMPGVPAELTGARQVARGERHSRGADSRADRDVEPLDRRSVRVGAREQRYPRSEARPTGSGTEEEGESPERPPCACFQGLPPELRTRYPPDPLVRRPPIPRCQLPLPNPYLGSPP